MTLNGLRKELLDVMRREPIVRSLMMQHPMQDPSWDAGVFYNLTMEKKPTPPGLVEYVRHEIEAHCAADAGENERQYQAYMVGLEEIWPALEVKMQRSYGLAEYMRVIGCGSLYLPRYYAKMPDSASMLAPYGLAVRLDGKLMAIPTHDPAYLLCGREPIFRTILVRAAEQQLVQLELGEGANVMSLGAATLPEYSRFGWQERGIKQNVIAVENAPDALKYVQQIYPGALESYGIKYLRQDFWDVLRDPVLQRTQGLVGMEGGLSYYVDKTEDLLQAVANVLKPGGYFCGEVELKHLYTGRCGVLGWEMSRPMRPDDNVESAIARIGAAAKQAGLKMVEVRPDEWNAQPAAVWFQLQKI